MYFYESYVNIHQRWNKGYTGLEQKSFPLSELNYRSATNAAANDSEGNSSPMKMREAETKQNYFWVN